MSRHPGLVSNTGTTFPFVVSTRSCPWNLRHVRRRTWVHVQVVVIDVSGKPERFDGNLKGRRGSPPHAKACNSTVTRRSPSAKTGIERMDDTEHAITQMTPIAGSCTEGQNRPHVPVRPRRRRQAAISRSAGREWHEQLLDVPPRTDEPDLAGTGTTGSTPGRRHQFRSRGRNQSWTSPDFGI